VVTEPTPEQGTHFWFISIQTSNARGIYTNSYQGAWTPPPGATRLDMFNKIQDLVETEDPRARGGMVIAFDIQPNQL
jgi:hypothetical protein